MTPERWDRIQLLFAELVDLPTAEQAERLAQACAGKPGLRHAVESLLRADGDARDGWFIRRVVDHAMLALAVSRSGTPCRMRAGGLP